MGGSCSKDGNFRIFKEEFFFPVFLGLHPWHMEIPKLGVELERLLLAYTTATATATPDLSQVCDLPHSSWQLWIFNPLSKARDRTQVLMDIGRVHYH